MEEEKRDLRVDPNNVPPLISGQCNFVIARKKRFCAMKPVNEKAFYCVEHLASVNGRKRIPCPLDSRHWIFEDDLELHTTKKCHQILVNKEQQSWKFYKENINLGQEEKGYILETDSDESKELKAEEDKNNSEIYKPLAPPKKKQNPKRLANLSVDKLMEFIAKVEKGYEKYFQSKIKLESSILKHDSCKHLLEQQSNHNQKHGTQEASMIGNLDKFKLLNRENIFVELGAGKGELSLIIQKFLDGKHILVDKQQNFRRRADRKVETESAFFRRLGLDIKDLNLGGIDEINQGKLVVFSKHLCGAATDLALRCVCNTLEKEKVAGVMIALCCHHKGTWNPYISIQLSYLFTNQSDKSFFLEELQFSPEEFNYLLSMTGWAIDGQSDEKSPVNKKMKIEENTEETEDKIRKLNKKELGWKAKRLIDAGRIQYLEQRGFKTFFMNYVDESITPENCLLVAIPNTCI